MTHDTLFLFFVQLSGVFFFNSLFNRMNFFLTSKPCILCNRGKEVTRSRLFTKCFSFVFKLSRKIECLKRRELDYPPRLKLKGERYNFFTYFIVHNTSYPPLQLIKKAHSCSRIRMMRQLNRCSHSTSFLELKIVILMFF